MLCTQGLLLYRVFQVRFEVIIMVLNAKHILGELYFNFVMNRNGFETSKFKRFKSRGTKQCICLSGNGVIRSSAISLLWAFHGEVCGPACALRCEVVGCMVSHNKQPGDNCTTF